MRGDVFKGAVSMLDASQARLASSFIGSGVQCDIIQIFENPQLRSKWPPACNFSAFQTFGPPQGFSSLLCLTRSPTKIAYVSKLCICAVKSSGLSFHTSSQILRFPLGP